MAKKFSEVYPRFTAKVKDQRHPKVFHVYDRERASWPSLVPGLGQVQQGGTEAEMLAEAQRLTDFIAAGGVW